MSPIRTTVKFRRDAPPFPRERECVTLSSTAKPTAAPTLPSQGEVLVVEDNFSVAKALSGVLRGAGFDATPVHNASAALEHCRTAAPCAAVIDIHLPDFNGLLLAQKLRDRLGAATPIIIVSGDTSMETIKSLSQVGATYFFSKPVNAKALVAQLKELLATEPTKCD